MNIFDFLTQDEIDDAPEDAALAFSQLVRIAQARLRDATIERDDRDDDDRQFLDDARHGFMNTVVSLGKSYGIEPFSTMEVPRYEKFDYGTHRQFKADLDHYMAQLVIGNSIRNRRDSVQISVDVKGRIRTHLHHIKEHIDKATMSDAKRASLHTKLSDFEAALEKDRLNIMAVGRVVLEILSVSANVAGLADSQTFHKLLSNVMVAVADAKAADDENRKLSGLVEHPLHVGGEVVVAFVDVEGERPAPGGGLVTSEREKEKFGREQGAKKPRIVGGERSAGLEVHDQNFAAVHDGAQIKRVSSPQRLTHSRRQRFRSRTHPCCQPSQVRHLHDQSSAQNHRSPR